MVGICQHVGSMEVYAGWAGTDEECLHLALLEEYGVGCRKGSDLAAYINGVFAETYARWQSCISYYTKYVAPFAF